MREIKFRAWDDDYCQMIYSDRHEIDTADYWWEIFPLRVGCVTGEFGGNTFEPPEPIVTYYQKIMQFTGLKDKNGRDVYEDDIVIYDNRIWKVVFSYDRWDMEDKNGSFVREDDCFDDPGHTDWSFCEIIGSVYENPELLK